MSQNSEINALISLLDDEDPEIFENVSSKIISFGTPIIPDLENAWGDSFNPKMHEIIEDLIHSIHFNEVYLELKNWANDNLSDLLEGFLILSKYHFPNLDKEATLKALNNVKQKIWLELNNSYTPLENIHIFNKVFYTILGFDGNYSNKTETKDFCLNSVLETKQGNSISLGVLYIILAQQLELPVYGVNLYRHFILAYQKNYIFDFDRNNADDTIFYLNPMNKGVPFQGKEIKDYLKSMNVEEKESFYNPAPTQAVLKEMLYYMQYHFVAKHEAQKADEISQLKDLID